jgi:hypothetical protein
MRPASVDYEPRDPEVEHLHVAVGRTITFSGFTSAVYDARGVGDRQRSCYLGAKPRDLVGRPRRGAGEGAERLSAHELHRDVPPSFGLADLVDRDDVRVVQRRGGAGLANEALDRATSSVA